MALFRAASGGGAPAKAAAELTAGWMAMAVRSFSRKRAEDVRKINPKVPREEAYEISEGLMKIVKDHGPLTVSNTWNRVKEAGINGVNSKTHMKILLKWMRGRSMLKLSCARVGNTKKFLYSIKTEDDDDSVVTEKPVLETAKAPFKGKKAMKIKH
ncbi:hypothetical protein LUZ60_002255 [Juncus effusus]|nr:hypothetical protein LUZ60_002255 [Juncus effusus]